MGGKTETEKTSEEWLKLLMEAQKEYQRYADDTEFRKLLRLLRKIKKKEAPPQEWYLAPSPEYPLTTNRTKVSRSPFVAPSLANPLTTNRFRRT